MLNKQYNKWLLILIGIGFFASLLVGVERYQVEQKAKQVELALEFHDLEDLAYQDGGNVEDLLLQFKKVGATTLVIEEASLERVIRRGWASLHRGGELIADEKAGLISDSGWVQAIRSGQVKPEWFYLAVAKPEMAKELEENISHRLGKDRVVAFQVGGRPVVGISLWMPEKIMEFPVGLFSEDLNRAEKAGLLLGVRPVNGIRADETYLSFLQKKLENRTNLTVLIPGGTEMIGFRHDRALDDQIYMDQFGQWMKSKEIRLGLVESATQLQFIAQNGLLPLAGSMDYQVDRVYTIYKEELKQLTLPVAQDRWPLAIKERNIKVAMVRKFEKLQGASTLTETHLNYIGGIVKGIEKEGFSLGKAQIMTPYHATNWALALMMSGVIASGVLLLTMVHPFNGKFQLGLWFLGTLVLAVPLAFKDMTLVRQLGALGAACIFPTLGLAGVLDVWRYRLKGSSYGMGKIFLYSVGLLFVAGLVSFMGASLMAGLLSDIRFFLEMDLFRGVKATFVVPLFLAVLVYLARFSITDGKDGDFFGEIKRILKTPATIQFLAVGFIGLIGVYILLGRSGHSDGFSVPGWEIRLRSFLENVFFTRPRSKELFIGHPALVMATFLWMVRAPRWINFGMTIVGSIGLASMVETFAHVRSPLFLSVVRGFDGIWPGAILGGLGIGGIYCLYLGWKRFGGKYE